MVESLKRGNMRNADRETCHATVKEIRELLIFGAPENFLAMNFIDIGANLLADHFQGVYYDKKKHESDLNVRLESNGRTKCYISLFISLSTAVHLP